MSRARTGEPCNVPVTLPPLDNEPLPHGPMNFCLGCASLQHPRYEADTLVYLFLGALAVSSKSRAARMAARSKRHCPQVPSTPLSSQPFRAALPPGNRPGPERLSSPKVNREPREIPSGFQRETFDPNFANWPKFRCQKVFAEACGSRSDC